MQEAAKAALQKAGFTIENLRIRVKELETENAKLKEPKTCETCIYFIDGVCDHIEVPEFDVPAYINLSGCGLHEPRYS